MQLNTCKGGIKKRPMIRCEQRFDNAKSCLCRSNRPVVLSCAVCFCYQCCVLIGSTGVLCVGEKTGGRERKVLRVVHNTFIPCTTLCSKESTQRSTTQHRSEGHTAPHRTAPHGSARLRTAPHGSARRYAALLGCISRAGLI